MHDGLESTLTILAHKLRKGDVAVERHYDRSLPHITAHGSQLNQVWTNLIDNAIDALDGAGTVEHHAPGGPATRWWSRSATTARGSRPSCRAGSSSRSSPPRRWGRAPASGSTWCTGSSTNHHGQVRVESSPGDTRFQVRLPLDALEPRLTSRSSRRPSRGTSTTTCLRSSPRWMRPGVPHRVVDWDDPGVDWAGFALVVVRSVWDYPRRREELLEWAERVAARAPLANPPGILRWNTDKRYLLDLARAGVPVVPTTIAAPGEAVAWPERTRSW